MHALKRIIDNERQALSLLPVINKDVSRSTFIKNIDPRDLIDFALEMGLTKPTVDFGVLKTHIEVLGGYIHLESKPVKQEWSYNDNNIHTLIGL